VFNAVFTVVPQHLMILPCEWNHQLHARLNTFAYCAGELISSHQLSHGHQQVNISHDIVKYVEDIPLNCERSASHNMFVCESRAKILHFMAQTYQDYDFVRYFSQFWKMYQKLAWNLVFTGHGV
jgi:hypothetical protein